jgi:hypothetical protein
VLAYAYIRKLKPNFKSIEAGIISLRISKIGVFYRLISKKKKRGI